MFYDPIFPFSQTSCEVFVSFSRKVPLVILLDTGAGRSVTNGLEEIMTKLVAADARLEEAVPRILQRDSSGEWASVTFESYTLFRKPMWRFVPAHLAHREIHLHAHPLHLPGIPRTFFFKAESHQRLCNVEHRHKHHSTNGLSWGYVGSGPRDLAINILAKFLPVTKTSQNFKTWGGTFVNVEAVIHSAAFMTDLITTLPKEGGTIDRRAVRLWLGQRRQQKTH